MFSQIFIDRPKLAIVISVVTVLVGLLCVFQAPIAEYPEIAPPAITVWATYTGAGSEEVANTVATVIEEQMNGLEHLLYFTSTSSNTGTYSLELTFKSGIDTDIAQVKVFIMGLVHFSPVAPDGISPLFFMHLAFVSVLLLYFPFSKLMHMPGVFFSPTRNLPTNTREVRHVNPWNPPKQYFTYAEYEDVYRDAMAEAGLPLEKQPSSKAAE